MTRTCQVLLRVVVFGIAGGLGGLAGGCSGCWTIAVARYRNWLWLAPGMVAFARVGPVVVYQFVDPPGCGRPLGRVTSHRYRQGGTGWEP